MTDRIKGIVVAFEEDLHEETAEEIIKAIKLIKGIANAKPSVADSEDYMNREQIRLHYQKKIWSVVNG